MHRCEEDIVSVVKDCLCPIAVVNIEVQDCYSVESGTRECSFDTYRDIVEKAEAHRTVGQCVVARGAHRAEDITTIGQDVIDRSDGCTSSSKGRFPRMLVGSSVSVERPTSSFHVRLESINMRLSVRTGELV